MCVVKYHWPCGHKLKDPVLLTVPHSCRTSPASTNTSTVVVEYETPIALHRWSL